MAPGGGKRKRPDQNHSGDHSQGRPSPHRPESLNLAQQNQRHDRRGGGNGGNVRRQSRGGNAGYSGGAGRDAAVAATTSSASAGSQRSTPQPASSPASNELTPVNDRSQARPQAAPAIPAPAPAEPQGPPAPYAYEHMTDDIVSGWQEQGRKLAVEALSQEDDFLKSSTWAHELLRSALDKRLDSTEAGLTFKSAVEARSHEAAEDLQSVMLDMVNLLDEVDWTRRSTLNPFLVSTCIPPSVWREQLDEEILTTLGLVREPHFKTTKIRKGTNLIYRQANYNLLREESEGYAKLITECFNTAMAAGASGASPTVAEDAFQRVKALVGSFDLDVGRVLDITLDVFANLLVRNFRFFVKYMRASSWWPHDNIPEAIKWQGQGFDSLPGWALPGATDWGMGVEEEERAAKLQPLKQTRDRKFWERVREVGMDAFSEIGSRHITNYEEVLSLLQTEVEAELDARGTEKDIIKRKRINDAKNWMRETKTLPPTGDADAANLLGFKLAFYASSARDKYDVMPENLIFLAALLIKIGFISLRDLYPHLYPPDEKMAEVQERLIKERQGRETAARPGGVAKNALAMAGALFDDLAPPPPPTFTSSKVGTPKPEEASTTAKAAVETKERLPEPPDQKILLLKSLLAIGALPEALYILGRFPWLLSEVSDLPEYIHRLLHHMLSDVYNSLRPLQDHEDMSDPQAQVGDSTGLPKGTINRTSAPMRYPRRWANLDKADHGEGVSYKFYWDDWADNVPICQNIDDVFLLCGTLLNLSGVKIGKDATLVSKLARIGRQSLKDDFGNENQSRWIDLLKRLLVPALSLTTKNPAIVNEVYELLKLFPISTRFSIYAEWNFGKVSRDPDLKNAFENVKAETKDVLKRISKTNQRAMGKALAKVAYSTPGVVLRTAISQMEAYENQIDVFVECSKYLTYLGYDVLVWCLLNALGSGGRNSIQADGMLTSSWLRALSIFAGSIFKRYSTIDPAPILQYVAQELRMGNSTVLDILGQMVEGMTGIKADKNYNDAQVIAMAGGPVLQAQTIMAMADERHKNERPTKRLIRSLTEPGLIGQLLISIAQEGQMYPHHESSKHAPLKVLGSNIDKIHQTFAQYLDLVSSNLSYEDFRNAVPDVASLIRDFGLEPGVAFMIGRSNIAHAVAEVDSARKLEQQEKARRLSIEKAQGSIDTIMTDGEAKALVNGHEAVNGKLQDVKDEIKTEDVMEGIETKHTDATTQELKSLTDDKPQTDDALAPSPTAEAVPLPVVVVNGDLAPWHPALLELIERVPDALGEDMASTMSIPFYVTFWSLGLQDILVNTHSYDQEIGRQTQLLSVLTSDRSDTTSAGTREKNRKIQAINEIKDRLTQEMKSQIAAYTQVRNRLTKEKDHWFQGWHEKPGILHASILQNCFLPRILLTPLDAHYTFVMLRFLHSNGTPEFNTLGLIDRLLREKQLAAIMFECTSREAENLGRFLNELLKELLSWHGDKTMYERNALGAKRQLPGFLCPSKTSPPVLLEYEDFRQILHKWHNLINRAFKQCFDSAEYMQVRNAIIVLKAIHQHFPAVDFMGRDMVTRLQNLGTDEKEQRADLKLAANSLLGNLRRREKSWVAVQAFRMSEAPATGTKSAASRSSTPQPTSSDTPKSLNATATEFKPINTAVKNEVKISTNANGEAEDGEIDDEKKNDTEVKTEEAKNSIKDESAPKPAVEKSGPTKPIQILKRPSSQPETTRGASTTPAPVPAPTMAGPARPDPTQATQDSASHALPARPERRKDLGPEPKPPLRSNQNGTFDRMSSQSVNRPDIRDRGPEDHGRLDKSSDLHRAQDPASRSRGPSPRRDEFQGRRDPRDGPSRYGERHDDRLPDRAPMQAAYAPERDNAMAQSRDRNQRDLTQRDQAHRDQTQRSQADLYEDAKRRTKEAMRPRDKFEGPRLDQGPRQAPHSGRSTPHSAPSGPAESQGAPARENPARLALITGESTEPQGRSLREPLPLTYGDRSRDVSQRNASPRRTDDRISSGHGYRDERNDRPDRGGTHTTSYEADRAPTGPRHSQRDLFDPSQSRQATSARQQEPTFGRLNVASEAPSGPRSMPSQSGGRNGYPPQTRHQNDAPQTSVPSSPSAARAPAAASAHFSRQQAAGPSSVPTPSVPTIERSTPVHPDRASQIPHIETNFPPAAPSGPRGSGGPPTGTPTGPSPSSRGPPSGPASSTTNQRGGADRRFAVLNDALQGGGDRGTSIRGRGRTNGSMLPPSTAAPIQPLPNTPQQLPREVSSRPQEVSNGPIVNPGRAPFIEQQDNSRPTPRQDESRRLDRHHSSRHTSREQAPPRVEPGRRTDGRSAHVEPDVRGPQGPSRDDYRNRRDGGDRPFRPDEHGSRAQMGGPPAMPQGSDLRAYGGPPDQHGGRRGQQDIGPARREEYPRGGHDERWHERGGPDVREPHRGSYDGRDGRGERDGRKRRGEDMPSGEPKRRRSGM